MNISIIIPTINRSQDLAHCLDCLIKQQKSPHQLIIIDHSLDILTQDLISQKKHDILNILYHRSVINSGAQARNRGIEHLDSATDIVVFIDDDTSFGSEFLLEIEQFFEKNPAANGGVAHITSSVRSIGIAKKIGFFLLT
jgi:glycosyltransferase involved in cell wall biosynthesis